MGLKNQILKIFLLLLIIIVAAAIFFSPIVIAINNKDPWLLILFSITWIPASVILELHKLV